MIESYPAYARNYSGHCNVPSCTLISKNSSSGARFASRIAALANHLGRGRERTRRRKPRFQTSTKASRYRKGSSMSPYGATSPFRAKTRALWPKAAEIAQAFCDLINK